MPISKDNSNTKSAKKSSYKTRSKSKEDDRKLKKHNDSDSSEDDMLSLIHISSPRDPKTSRMPSSA